MPSGWTRQRSPITNIVSLYTMYAIQSSEQNLVMQVLLTVSILWLMKKVMLLNLILLTGKKKLILREETTKATIEEMFYPPEERFNGKKQIDVRKLNYSYYWVDYQQAAKSKYKYDYAEQTQVNMKDRLQTSMEHVPM